MDKRDYALFQALQQKLTQTTHDDPRTTEQVQQEARCNIGVTPSGPMALVTLQLSGMLTLAAVAEVIGQCQPTPVVTLHQPARPSKRRR